VERGSTHYIDLLAEAAFTRHSLVAQLTIKTAVWLACMALLLFVSAGTWRWPACWVYLAELGVVGNGDRLVARAPRPRTAGGAHVGDIRVRAAGVGQGAHGHLRRALDRLARAQRARCRTLALVAGSDLAAGGRCRPGRARLLRLLSHLPGKQLRRTDREDSERARPPRRQHRSLCRCPASDVCRRPPLLHRHAVAARLLVGACRHAPLGGAVGRPRAVGGAHAGKRASRLPRLRRTCVLSPRSRIW